ncbi:MAG: plasmid pRiA4b ORF-3 family protein [Rhizobiaceae bacterium]|nr:plasmid pRiA4b ORF-3 family protein [Rhizobiaceae bacterium]
MAARQFLLNITLREVEPPVWRQIGVPGDFTLASLHTAIQGVMGWHTAHLHAFEIDGKRYEERQDEDFDTGVPSLDEEEYRVEDVLAKGRSFTYTYDFADDWQHDIIVEDVELVEEADAGDLSPRCVDGEGACPPEDCGGPAGYADLLGVLADPNHPEHDDAVDFVGTFDPEIFSVPQANSLVYALLALEAARKAMAGG